MNGRKSISGIVKGRSIISINIFDDIGEKIKKPLKKNNPFVRHFKFIILKFYENKLYKILPRVNINITIFLLIQGFHFEVFMLFKYLPIKTRIKSFGDSNRLVQVVSGPY